MYKILANWNKWLGKNMFFGVLTALILGFNFPMVNSPTLEIISVGLFAYLTFVTSLGISLHQFFRQLVNPYASIWMIFLIHVAAPLIALIVGYIFYPDDPLIRIGFLISASIPIAVTSIMWTSITKGNVALSLVTVTLDTFATPIILPIFLFIIVGQNLEINYFNLVIKLLVMVTIPSLVGMTINDLTHGRLDRFYESFGGFTSKLSLYAVIFINAAVIAPEIKWNASIIKLLVTVFILSVLGYLLGYLGSFFLKKRNLENISCIIYNVGMRNISFGAVLAVTYFPPTVAIPITLAMLYQQPLAVVASYFIKYLSSKDKFRIKEKHAN